MKNQNWFTFIVEDLAIKEIQEDNRNSMNRCIGDAGWRMLSTMIQYKCDEEGKNFIKIGRWDKSSKTCSCCGYIKSDLKLSDREWYCPNCNTKHNRDQNASINIKKFSFVKNNTAGTAEIYACGNMKLVTGSAQ